jgi:hypothetical protein
MGKTLILKSLLISPNSISFILIIFTFKLIQTIRILWFCHRSGYAKISARGMLDHLFETYGDITAVDLEINFENMHRAWVPQQPVKTLFKQIQDCDVYSEAGGVLIGHPKQINVGYAKIFAACHFMSACRRWNEKPTTEKTWTQFKSHFAAAYRQHKQMQGEYASTAEYHSANADVTQNEDQMAEAAIGA